MLNQTLPTVFVPWNFHRSDRRAKRTHDDQVKKIVYVWPESRSSSVRRAVVVLLKK